ncbi:ATP-binding cassette domain-containing protein [Maribellus comscasis]|uniref:ATP-binding cassette domain-containing protein n=1 Tax=Maribellus comscasis TaxID=2681766 RepID=A0A6I6JQA8_9BACT|nr:ABC transporter ATP-binding protein [Maribellus comscasis]QGY42193.1 ATP-binding cassette domain-containing protein [Maribellus comscasis]
MKQSRKKGNKAKKSNAGLLKLLKPYKGMIFLLIVFALISNAANLLIPRIISHGIDSYSEGNYVLKTILTEFSIAAGIIFFFTMLQTVVQTFASEKVGFDLRKNLSDKISRQSYAFIQDANPSKLLTNLTSDMDSVKMFVSVGVSSIVSSTVMIIGTSVFLLIINWRLAIPVLFVIPLVGITFFIILKKVRVLFVRSREVIDWLNRVINESILGAAIIRVINSQQLEYRKFLKASAESRDIGISIVTLFATLIPLINFFGNLATLTILVLGGHLVISGNMSLGDFAAFTSYVAILIFPIIVIGFISNMIAQASASYERIESVLKAEETADTGTVDKSLEGNIEIKNVSVFYDGKPALKNVSFSIKSGSRTAIIGPTAAGKSQLLYLFTSLIQPREGTVEFDGIDITEFNKETFHRQVGFVFQDSVMFNMSLRENIAFSDIVTDESLEKAIETAELKDFIGTLSKGLDTIVSERGTSLSGGQKQRIMLARALALNPKILLLDDFTARVDQQTEQKILKNVQENYPDLTLISVTQKISPVKDFDQILLLMEGELVAAGKHKDLRATSPEYVQIYESQKSTSHYELQS